MKRKAYSFMASLAMVALGMGCSDDSGVGGNQNNINQSAVDSGVDALVQTDTGVVDDPFCPAGQQCLEVTESGRLGCMVGDEPPPSAMRDCIEVGCDGNARCTYTDDTETESACLDNCGGCLPGTTCGDITDGYLGCLDNGDFPSGVQTGCYDGTPCTGNTTCWYYSDTDPIESFCIQNCSGCQEGTCPEGEVCGASGTCEPAPCTEGSCDTGEICYSGTCIPDIGPGPGVGPGPTCTLPPLECTDGATACNELIQFTPDNNPAESDYDPMLGYIEYPENGETWTDQYRSFLRRDLMMAIQYAAAKTACAAQAWTFGNGGPLGTIDMSEADGAIPGTSIGSPGHPSGTHTDGFDIDMAYYQINTSDNAARPVCDHYEGGSEAYHCTAPPHLLDPWRTAMFLGALFEHPSIRVVGVDGKVGPMVEACMDILCDEGWLTGTASCTASQRPLTYEETDQGWGWYLFHHHHFHVSFSQPSYKRAQTSDLQCLIDGCHQSPLVDFLADYGLKLPASAVLRRAQ